MSTAPVSTPDEDALARAWHAFSDEAMDGIAFGGSGCTCHNYARQMRHVFALFTGAPVPEPDGLGAVAVNPLTGDVWVRAAHPALPWYDPDVADQPWMSPTTGDWFTWDDLSRPLVVQSTGWAVPLSRRSPNADASEPTGLGAIVTDGTGRTWVRVEAGGDPWLDPASLAEGVGIEATWDDLDHPVTVRSHGWHPM